MESALYERLDGTLAGLRSDIGAAECHGMLCGMLCGPGQFNRDLWLHHMSGQDDIEAYQSEAATLVFADLESQTVKGMESETFEFSLLLPDDDSDLTLRVEALSAWCRGFLSGLGASGVSDLGSLGVDAREFVTDLERFRALTLGDDDSGDEQAFVELTEFARMGALIVYAERNNGQEPGESTLH